MLFEAVDRNLREAMKFFHRANEAGEVRQLPGILLISSGINYGVFNSALITEPVADVASFERRLLAAQVFFGARGLRWTFWACEDLLARGVRRREENICARFGLRQLTEPPGMFAETLSAPERIAPEIEIRAVKDAATRMAFCEIAATTFDLPLPIATEIYTQPTVWESTFHGFVGYVGETAVTTAATVVDDGIAGVYSVATLSGWRRRGYAEAAIRYALDEARREFGMQASVLQSTRFGVRLYQRMGYRTVTRFHVYLREQG